MFAESLTPRPEIREHNLVMSWQIADMPLPPPFTSSSLLWKRRRTGLDSDPWLCRIGPDMSGWLQPRPVVEGARLDN